MKYDLIQEYSTEQVIGRLSSYLQKRIKTDFWDEEYGLENSVQVVICDDFTPIANSLKNKSNLEEFEFKDVKSYEIDKEFINNLPVPQGKSGGILIISDYLDLLKQIEQKMRELIFLDLQIALLIWFRQVGEYSLSQRSMIGTCYGAVA